MWSSVAAVDGFCRFLQLSRVPCVFNPTRDWFGPRMELVNGDAMYKSYNASYWAYNLVGCIIGEGLLSSWGARQGLSSSLAPVHRFPNLSRHGSSFLGSCRLLDSCLGPSDSD